jgi:hypothetical protein
VRNNGERNGTTSALGRAVVDGFRRDGYYLHRGLFPRAQAEEAAAWLRAQDGEKLAKSWTEQEPAVPLVDMIFLREAARAAARPNAGRHEAW